MRKEMSNVIEHSDGIFTFTREITWLHRIPGIMDFGWGNGYIAVPEGHRLYGKHYDDIDDIPIHGGWTYSDEEEHGDKKYWVFGFDTAHYSDKIADWPPERVVEEIVSSIYYFKQRQIAE